MAEVISVPAPDVLCEIQSGDGLALSAAGRRAGAAPRAEATDRTRGRQVEQGGQHRMSRAA